MRGDFGLATVNITREEGHVVRVELLRVVGGKVHSTVYSELGHLPRRIFAPLVMLMTSEQGFISLVGARVYKSAVLEKYDVMWDL